MTSQCPFTHNFDPLDPEYVSDPYAVLNAAREAQPVFFAPSIGYWVITRYEDVKAILSDPETFSAAIALEPLVRPADEALAVLRSGLGTTPVLVDLDPPGHTRVRRRVADALSPRRVHLLKPTIVQRASRLIDGFAADGRADLVDQLAFPLPALTIFALLGFPNEDAEHLKRWCTNKVELTWGRPSAEYQLRAATDMATYWNYCVAFVERRKREPADDLASELIEQRTSDAEALNDQELASVLFALSFAGHETTTKLLSNTLVQLLSPERPGLWQEVCANPLLIPAMVEETLRFDTPVLAWRRLAARDSEVGGVRIPAGARLMLAFAAANHDPRHFAHPEFFDVGRHDARSHLSFGWGIHFCLGANLARVECEIVLGLLCDRFPSLHLCPDQRFQYPQNMTFHAPDHLWAEWPVHGHLSASGLNDPISEI